jgi:uncharacterized membrane protein (UPF0182 family)
VAYENRIVMEPRLDDAIAQLFGGVTGEEALTPETLAPAVSDDLEMIAREAKEHYHRAMEARQAGDWATYGERLRLVREALDKMRP